MFGSLQFSKILPVLDRPLPKTPWLKSLTLLTLAALPFVPLQLFPLERQIAWMWPAAAILSLCSIYALLNRAVAALVIAEDAGTAIRAKQLNIKGYKAPELLRDLDTRPVLGFFQLVVVLSMVALTLTLSMSSMTYGAINHFGLASPFGLLPESVDVFLLFVNEAVRGFLFRLFDILKIGVPHKLSVEKVGFFSLVMWAYHASMTLLTVQVMLLAFSFYRAKLDPEVERFYKELQTAKEDAAKSRQRAAAAADAEQLMRDEKRLEEVLENQRRNGGRLTEEEREQLEYGMHYDLSEQVQSAFEEDDRVRRPPKRGGRNRSRENSGALSKRKRRKLEARRDELREEKENSGWLEQEEWDELRELERTLGRA